jgi:hypothetical protein
LAQEARFGVPPDSLNVVPAGPNSVQADYAMRHVWLLEFADLVVA